MTHASFPFMRVIPVADLQAKAPNRPPTPESARIRQVATHLFSWNDRSGGLAFSEGIPARRGKALESSHPYLPSRENARGNLAAGREEVIAASGAS